MNSNSISNRTVWLSLAAVTAALLATAPTARSGVIPVYADGHCDLGAEYRAAEQELHLHYLFHTGSPGLDEDGNPLEGKYAPSELHTRVSDETKTTVPSGTAYGFLGVPAGSDVWILPQGNMPGQPYLGFGTEELDWDDWSTLISYTLVSVDGPGEFSMWMSQPFGDPIVHWATSDGIVDDGEYTDVYEQPALAHSHANWGFTAEGVYHVQMQLSGTLADGTTLVSSDVGTFTFLVGSNTGTGSGLPGDANGDGVVNSGDLDVVRANWGQTGDPGALPGDLDSDGRVSSGDLDLVRANWGSTATAAILGVPEPGGVLLLCLCVGAVSIVRHPNRRSRRQRYTAVHPYI